MSHTWFWYLHICSLGANTPFEVLVVAMRISNDSIASIVLSDGIKSCDLKFVRHVFLQLSFLWDPVPFYPSLFLFTGRYFSHCECYYTLHLGSIVIVKHQSGVLFSYYNYFSCLQQKGKRKENFFLYPFDVAISTEAMGEWIFCFVM